MARSDEIPDSLLDMIYDAATEPHLWVQILLRIATLLDSPGGILFGQSFGEKIVFFEHNGGLSDEASRIYKERHMDNPWSAHMKPQPVGRVVSSEEAMPLAELQRTAFFDEVIRPQRLGYNAMVALTARQGFVAAFNINRGVRQGPYREAELNHLARLVPHMRRSMELGLRIGGYRALQRAEHQVLDRLSMGVILLDREAKVLFANALARAWSAGDGFLRIRQGRIVHAVPLHSHELQALIQSALRGAPMAARSLPRHPDEPPLVLLASPVRGNDRDRFADLHWKDAAVMLFLSSPAPRQDIPEGWLSEAYGLTRAEARVALAVSAGTGVIEAARHLRVSPNTIKTHLHRVFDKTATSSQVELARLLAPIGLLATDPQA